MSKEKEVLDMSAVVAAVRNKWKDKDPDLAKKIGTGDSLANPLEGDFIKMPDWWTEMTNTPGIPFGKLVMIAGDSDSGKTSAAIQVIKAAQEQNCKVIYAETENKTSVNDIVSWGVNPKDIGVVHSPIAEEAFQLMFDTWENTKRIFPTHRILIVFDSIGNTISERDATIDLTDQKQKPGGKGQINRLGINKMIAMMEQDKAAVFVVNYTYDNIGSPGKTNAGGKAVNFFSSLTYQTTRKAWYEKTVKGEKVRCGVDVKWVLFKNHINKQSPGAKETFLRISNDGIQILGKAKIIKDSTEEAIEETSEGQE